MIHFQALIGYLLKRLKNLKNVAFLITKEGGHTGFCQGWRDEVSYAEEVSLDFCNRLKNGIS